MSNRKSVLAYSIPLGILILLTMLSPLGQQTYVAARTSDDSDSNDNSDSSSDDSNSNSNDNSDHSSDSGSEQTDNQQNDNQQNDQSSLTDKICNALNTGAGASLIPLLHLAGIATGGTVNAAIIAAQGYCAIHG
jgi:hypothetical protein